MKPKTRHGAASGTRQPIATAHRIAQELNRYDEHLRDVRGLADGTRKNYIAIVERLLSRIVARRSVESADLRPDDVREFLAHQIGRCQTPAYASKLTSALRSYLRYRTDKHFNRLKASIAPLIGHQPT